MLMSKEQHWRSPAKKLEEEKTARLQGWQEKSRGTEKLITCFNKPSKCLKGMIVGDQENVFFLNLDLSYRRY